jgi:FkbM family methyltransferase
MQASSLSLPATRSVENSSLATQFKRLCGRALISTCEAAPALRAPLSRWGVRTWKHWSRDGVRHVFTPEGRSFAIAGDNYLTFELFWKGTGYYEPISTMLIRELLAAGDTFVDVGANIGFHSLLLSTYRPGVDVVAFEPNPHNFELLSRNARLNGYANMRCEQMAMSDHTGTGQLYLAKSDMSASLVPDFEEVQGAPVEVRITTLDDYLAQHDARGRLVIKVDVEGHEAAFFRGAARTIEERRPDIVAEVTEAYDGDLTDFFKRLGYHFYPVTDRGLVPTDALRPVIRDRLVFLNCLISARSPAELAKLYDNIAPVVREIDLTRTSKYLTPESVARFSARAARPHAVSR